MKKTALTLFAFFAITNSYAQNKLEATGNVGIGTLNPISTLDVKGNIMISNADIPMGINTEVLATTPILNMSMNFREVNKNLNYIGAAFRIDTRLSFTPLFQWLYRPANTDVESMIMVLNANGDLGVGTSSPTERLSVNGKIRAREIKVESNNWPDYVFHPAYILKPLADVEDYITQHHHLPEIPSQKQVSNEGIALGEMNASLLKKIEELTLYVIELNKVVQKQQSEINKLKSNN